MSINFSLAYIKIFHSNTDIGANWFTQMYESSIEFIKLFKTCIPLLSLLVSEVETVADDVQIRTKFVVNLIFELFGGFQLGN